MCVRNRHTSRKTDGRQVEFVLKQLQSLKGEARKFAREEDGTLLIFGVYVFLIILMMGGIGIDMMRFERDRTNLQYTLDRAVLAAADLDQTLDPQSVVEDYFAKAGLAQYLSGVTVTEGLGFRNVQASASADIKTQFMHMGGVDTLSAPANSTAEESIGSVEISLVLDVSGSMNSNSRLTNLKSAARDFVDQMVDNTEDGKMSMSIIPYATQVSVPGEFLDQFNVTDEHDFSHCVNFRSVDFDTTAINDGTALERTMHFDIWSGSSTDRRPSNDLVPYPVCEHATARETLIMQKDRNTLKNFITNLSARGNTSIDLGMKWGTALLDPSVRAATNAMIGQGDIPADFASRPSAFNDGDTLKVIVLMTDGQNTSQYYVDEDFRTGGSTVWWNDSQEHYSIYDPSRNQYYWRGAKSWPIYASSYWHDHPYGNGTYTKCGWYYYGSCRDATYDVSEAGSATELEFAELWARTSVQYNRRKNMEPWMGYYDARDEWYYDVRRYVGSSTKNSRTKDICDAAKAAGTIVYTIGFEAPYSGQVVLADCASSAAHYFDVDGLEITEAFASIASSIRKLRLTQ
jgi:Flp pilus assembly protein TadG